MRKYVCPLCESEITLTQTKDWCLDAETGEIDCPTVDNYFHCDNPDCDWDSAVGGDVIGEVIDINLKNNKL